MTARLSRRHRRVHDRLVNEVTDADNRAGMPGF
jgi:hypothetical protein